MKQLNIELLYRIGVNVKVKATASCQLGFITKVDLA
jgi:hypothetical protein